MKYIKLIIVLLLSCQNKNETKTINQPIREIEYIKKDILDGDTLAYIELRNIYLDDFSGDFLYWAIFMSNKYNYSNASYDVFEILLNSYVGDIERINEMDDYTKIMALKYLKKSYIEGNITSKEILEMKIISDVIKKMKI